MDKLGERIVKDTEKFHHREAKRGLAQAAEREKAERNDAHVVDPWRRGSPFPGAASQDTKPLHPWCPDCGWRKGGLDSWDGSACKCGHSAPPLRRVEEKAEKDAAERHRQRRQSRHTKSMSAA